MTVSKIGIVFLTVSICVSLVRCVDTDAKEGETDMNDARKMMDTYGREDAIAKKLSVMPKNADAEMKNTPVMPKITDADVRKPLVKAIADADVKKIPVKTIADADVKKSPVKTFADADVKKIPVKTIADADVKKPLVKKTIADADVKKPLVKKTIADADVKKPLVKKTIADADVKKPLVKKTIADADVKKRTAKKKIAEIEKTDTKATSKTPSFPSGCLEYPAYINNGAVRKRKSTRKGYPVVIEYECDGEGTEKYKYVSGTTEARCDSKGKWTLPAMICVPTTCYLQTTVRGSRKKLAVYAGDEARTITNRTCQNWANDYPRFKAPFYRRNTVFPFDTSVLAAGKKCRTPDFEPRPWCYAVEKGKRWEFCDVPKCKKVAKCASPPHMIGKEPIKTELVGQEVKVIYRCHNILSYLGEERTATCNLKTGIWTLPNMLCASMECFYVRKDGHAVYKGTVSVTKSGRSCQSLDSMTPHRYTKQVAKGFNTTFASTKNRCQDIFAKAENIPWCYTMDPNMRWEECAIRECNLSGLP